MSRRTLLSAEKRSRLFGIPTDRAEMAGHYILHEEELAFVAEQLSVPPAAFGGYAERDQTRREHGAELQAALRLRSFRLADWRACLRVGAEAAWATDRGEPIVAAMLAHPRREGVVVPGAAGRDAGPAPGRRRGSGCPRCRRR